jgi:hypothetical protein
MTGGVDLVGLESAVQHALRTGDDADLRVLGRGEISLVLGAPGAAPRWACKRLPPFTPAGADRYTATFERYLDALGQRGVRVLHTELHRLEGDGGTVVLWCVQPVLPASSLAVEIVRHDEERAPGLLGAIVTTVLGAVDQDVGLDAQLSNWASVDDQVTYLDVTTPLLRAPDGTPELDVGVFLASLPWVLRAPARRFVVPGLIDRYHQPRGAVLDLAGNLVKEQLDRWIPTVLAAAGDRIDPPLLEDEVRRDHRSDARTWAALQAVRRADRAWQRHVRRRTYPFLLPGRIER